MTDHYRPISGTSDYGEDGGNRRRGVARFFPGAGIVGSEMAQEYLQRVFLYFMTYGAAFLLVGVICIVLPIVFVSVSIQYLVAWILVIGGAAAVVHFLLVFGSPGTTTFLVLGIVHLAVGLWILFQRSVRHGNAFVWLLFGWFFIHGLLKLLMGCEVRTLRSWIALVISGVVSILLAILNIALAGLYGFRVICIMFGVDLAVTGLAFLMVSSMAYYANRSADRTHLLGDA
ncbi:hypothetical protein KP509_20G001800 [Ceratopteris richardii]|uniref:HdeD family acid-resistance protein n=1 Tax=Ceratopteris richardii TaxID=49495 RepID=A0A8T2SCE6_CERRI|nr:hypothetical protein KP509_20G001800 [Ceratopteris richardii]